MNAIVQHQEFGLPSAKLQGQAQENLGAGVSGGYGSIGYKGKTWSIRYKGDDRVLMREDGDGARASIELVIIKASEKISKVWYESGFTEGSNAKPDCFSTTGLTPDPTSGKKQASICASCPRNAFGSAVKQDGTPGKGKACSDSRRMAVVPLADIDNEMLGGPMLLRVPAGSLNDVATFGSQVQKLGHAYFGIGTRIAFDVQEAYPKFILSPIRPLTDAEADKVLALRDDERTSRVLSETVFEPAAQAEAPALAFEQPAPAAAAAPAVAAPATVVPAAVVTPAVTAPAPASTGFGTAAPAAEPAKQRAPRTAKAPVVVAAAAPTPTPAAVAAPAEPVATAAAPAVAAGGFGAAAAPTAQAAPAVVSDPSFDADLDAQLASLLGS